MATVIQRSFAGGEIAPALYSRVDVSKYQSGLRTCRNMLVMRHGGLTNRPGTRFIGQAKNLNENVRLIPFSVSRTLTYVIEMGKFYFRFIRNGAYITEAAKTITFITKANPAVVSSASHGFSNGDDVILSGIVGMTELNGRTVRVSNATTNEFEITDLNGNDIDSSAFTTYSSGGSASKIYELATDYNDTHLFDIRYVQSADVMTFAHPYYPPTDLRRTSDTNWSLSSIDTTPGSYAGVITVTGGPAGSETFRYKVTQILTDQNNVETTGENATGQITSKATPTAASPININFGLGSATSIGNLYKEVNGVFFLLGFAQGSSVDFKDFGQDVDTSKTIPVATDLFQATGYTVSSISQADPCVVATSSAPGEISTGDPVIIFGGDMTEVRSNLYFASKSGSNITLLDENGDGIDSTAFTAYTSGAEIYRVGEWPSAVTYFQQRRCFANTVDQPERIFGSKTGQISNFVTSIPIQDDDALEFQIAGAQVNKIEHLLDLNSLVVFTESGEWAVDGDDAGILRPTSINPKQQSYNGSNNVKPIVVGRSALYVQARGSVVRDLGFEFSADGYQGNDLTIFSAHLFDDFNLVDGAYQQIPHSVAYYVRDDGVLLALTYVREQGVIAWSRHDFSGGLVKSVATISEAEEDSVYVVVEREIDGNTVKYIERLETREFTDVLESKFMDSHLTYDGRNTSATTMTLSGGTDWDYLETLTLTASASYFSSDDVGSEIHLTDSSGGIIRFSINTFSSATVVTGKANRTVPVSLRSTAATSWSKAVKTFRGLDHLEGEQVSIFADGFVVASPNNASYDTVTVTNGAVTLAKAYSFVHIGLPYLSDVESLDIDTVQGETMVDKRKMIQEVTVFVEDSRGLWAGPKPPSNDTVDPLEGLTEFKLRQDEGYDDPVELKTEPIDVIIRPEWNSNGRVFMRQVDPVPLSVLSVAPAGYIPFGR